MNALIDILRQPGTVVCGLPGDRKVKLFHQPIDEIQALEPSQVFPALVEVEDQLRRGRFAAGFISYEAAAAFDPANQTRQLKRFPYCWFGVYERPFEFTPPKEISPVEAPALTPEISRSLYLKDLDALKRHIRDGDVYQANYTFRSRGAAPKDPEKLFLSLVASHPVPYPAYVNAVGVKALSNSPELFLERSGNQLLSLPMKGTAARALMADRDRQVAEGLSKDPKNQAENVMIVDMVRHDFGKICEFGTIRVEPLHHVDTYRTVHQMISGVHGRIRDGTGLSDALAATFPPASITGAPKIRAMELIRELEASPRKIYTGAIGCFAPNGDFRLNVAIRTLVLQGDRSELGIGSGVVADSRPEAEWDECLLKSRFVSARQPEFEILETMLWRRSDGFVLLEEHLRRALNSQRHFGRPWRDQSIQRALRTAIEDQAGDADLGRCRLRVDRNGEAIVEFAPLSDAGWGDQPLKLALSTCRVDSKNPFQYHKTTHRAVYDEEFKNAKKNELDEVIFLNEKGHLAEGAISNVFIQRPDGRWTTPALACGLLPGIQREKLIRELRADEVEIPLDDLRSAKKILVCNSVRASGAVGEIRHHSDSLVFSVQ